MSNVTEQQPTIEQLAEKVKAAFVYHVRATQSPISDASELYNYHHALAYEKMLEMLGYSKEAIVKLWQK